MHASGAPSCLPIVSSFKFWRTGKVGKSVSVSPYVFQIRGERPFRYSTSFGLKQQTISPSIIGGTEAGDHVQFSDIRRRHSRWLRDRLWVNCSSQLSLFLFLK